MIKLFPYNLLRIAGLEFNIIEKMDSIDWVDVATNIKNSNSELNKLRLTICEELLVLIQNTEIQHKQHQLLNIRRDIFNKKVIKSHLLGQIKLLVNDSVYNMICHYIDLTNQKDELYKFWNAKYQEISLSSKRTLQKISGNNQFLRGLSFSSIDLLQDVKYYQVKDVTDFKKKDADTEMGVLKYLTRMACKTSPFSTFTNIALGKSENTDQAGIQYITTDKKSAVNGHIRINSYLLGYIKSLLLTYKRFYRSMPIKLNPTLQKGTDADSFLASHNNVEAFQRIEHNVINSLIFSYLETNERVSFDGLTGFLCEHVNASKENIRIYVKKLVDYGLIEFDFPISGNDPDWDIKLIDFLVSTKDKIPYIAGLVTLLRHLREVANKLAVSSGSKRSDLINSAFVKSKDFFYGFNKSIHFSSQKKRTKVLLYEVNSTDETESSDNIPANQNSTLSWNPIPFPFSSKQIFYEDTTRELVALIDNDKLSELADLLNNLITSLNGLEYRTDEIRKMTRFFKAKYKKRSEVTFLNFYEDYYKDIKLHEEELEATDQLDEEQLRIKQLRIDWQNKFLYELNRSNTFNNYSVNLTQALINEVNNGLGLQPNIEKGTSMSCIAQLYAIPDKDQKLYAVLHGAMQGYGKMFSRFLHLLDKNMLSELKKFNINELNPDYSHIENTDASYHNSNLHPPLLEYEVRVPGGHNSVSRDKQHLVSDFIVRFNEHTQKIELVNKLTNQQTITYDLGFLGLEGRSKQYQLLNEFSDNNSFNFSFLFNAMNLLTREKSSLNHLTNCIIYPRIVLEDQIVLRRRQWVTPKDVLPLRNVNEGNADYFLRINEWRMQLDIPDKVFVFVDPERSHIQKKIDKTTLKATRDDYKPQYISFNNVLLVALFEKIIKRVPRVLKIEEMLPNADQLVNIDGEWTVTESVIQWYN